uniref:26S proteasome nonATPase regulatory subunit putative n=1 Tax=Albugo laibachii Nc14 TaxID=890382 RepID=F0VZW2_9STRA|nr:26S proteasome nonATPase regulatory subunit putative [Albugo laibachii Nc14]|eukprot:CCA14333.1 26S proteasome nonATPase regulatory subunit putative [Albugo laibachii Nc14]
MSPDIRALEGEAKKLRALVEEKSTSDASKLSKKLKLELISLPSLPPCGVHSPTAARELSLAQHVLESATILSILNEDLADFERNVVQLKVYYGAVQPESTVASSSLFHPLMGTRLLHLLVENRMADFHNELELLDESDRNDANIAFGIKIEQYLMEGSYNKVLDARNHVPNQLFSFFLSQLLQTVRENIADCSQMAYQCLGIADAQKMLMFNSTTELSVYVREQRPEWTVKGSMIWFKAPGKKLGGSDIPSLKLVGEMLAYATELDRIV